MIWHDQKNGRSQIELWEDCGAPMLRYVCGRPRGHEGDHSVYACVYCGGVLLVEPDLRDEVTGDTTRAHAAHVCDQTPHSLSLRGRAVAWDTEGFDVKVRGAIKDPEQFVQHLGLRRREGDG